MKAITAEHSKYSKPTSKIFDCKNLQLLALLRNAQSLFWKLFGFFNPRAKFSSFWRKNWYRTMSTSQMLLKMLPISFEELHQVWTSNWWLSTKNKMNQCTTTTTWNYSLLAFFDQRELNNQNLILSKVKKILCSFVVKPVKPI